MSKRTVAAAIAIGVLALAGCSDDDSDPATPGLTVGWGGSKGTPRVYDASDHTVECRLTIEGETPHDDEVTVTLTVSAYADENTSRQVGSGSRTVHVAGTVDQPLVLTFPVERAPHVDEDGETACTLSVVYSPTPSPSG